MKERTVKLLSILLALSLLFGLVGCKAGQRKQELDEDVAAQTTLGEDNADSEPKDLDEEEAPAEDEAEAEADEPAEEADAEDETEEPAEEADAETHEDKVNKLAALDADSAANFLLDNGFKVYDITKIKPLDVKRAIFAANYDPEKMMQGFKLLIESGLLDNLLGEKAENIGDIDIAKLLDRIPIDAVLNYLATLKVNFYNVFYISFEDAEAAEEAFYTGKGIISLTDAEKQQVGEVTEKVKSEIPAIQKEIQKILTTYMIEHPEQASKAIALLQDILIQISQPEWVIQEEGQLVRRIAVELPMGTIFIEEAQRDEHVFLLISLITTDDESKIVALNEGLHICEVSPAELISLK
ncbi:MAG: hypothetical protein Q4P65_01455 [Eubacteriales bacterium]|nr:hypothetical protein [Eubacteriales bacterium]